jgi:hypothetical protein
MPPREEFQLLLAIVQQYIEFMPTTSGKAMFASKLFAPRDR